jgi:hypothetical protein
VVAHSDREDPQPLRDPILQWAKPDTLHFAKCGRVQLGGSFELALIDRQVRAVHPSPCARTCPPVG